MFIPIAGWVGKIAKVDKLIPDELLALLKTQGINLAKQLNTKTRNAQLRVLQQCAELLEIFAKGRQAIKEFFTKLGDDIGKWFVSNKRTFENLVAKAKNIFKKDSKTDELFRDISKKFIVKNHGNLSKTKFLKIAKQIEKHFGTKLHWVDRNSYEFKELYKKWYDSPIYAVFHSSTFKNGRYGITLEGPAIYFFEGVHKFGGTIKLTTYTLQHELIHVKLWYKMTKEFPELSPLYKKIPRWLDEANVIAEFLQQNAQKIGKWEMDDILNDLKVLNKIFRDNPAYREGVKKIFGKEQLELKDFENWDLSKFLEKL